MTFAGAAGERNRGNQEEDLLHQVWRLVEGGRTSMGRSQEPGVRSQESGVRSQELGARRRELDDRETGGIIERVTKERQLDF
jgi:hypothetical protein